ncbi:sugar transferase [Streptomyces sp. NPDC088788]|uniref:sugar transferase n=1 Tax=Streptomyces sp. NPDC088788 TaxID=3365898 RepID=UPI003806E627
MMEDRGGRDGQSIPQQAAGRSSRDETDPVGEALLAGYLAEVEETAAQVITAQKTDDLLLKIKVQAYTRAAMESHQSGDDTLTNLVVQPERLVQVTAAPPPARRPVKNSLRLATAAQLTAAVLALLQLHVDSAGGMPDVVITTAMVVAILLTAVMLWRKPGQRQPLPGLVCEPAALSRTRRAVDVAVAATALLMTAPVMLVASLSVAVRRRPVMERKVRVGQGGYPIRLLKYRSDPRRGSERIQFFEHFPRLWNLLRGDLTLVGPKPEPPEVAERYPENCRWVFQHRPGLIGAVYEDVEGRDADTDIYLAEIVPAQVHMYESVLFNERLAPRLLGNAAIAMLAFRPGGGRLLGHPAAGGGIKRPQRSAPERDGQVPAGGEHFRLERWSLHETVSA